MGDYVEPSTQKSIFGKTSSTGAPRPFPGSPACSCVCPDTPSARESPAVRTYFAEITSVAAAANQVKPTSSLK